MAPMTISVLALSALAALSTVFAVPQDIDNPLPTDINALLLQANIDLASGMAEAASLFNDPAFQASMSNAALSFSEFAEKTRLQSLPFLLACLLSLEFLPTIKTLLAMRTRTTRMSTTTTMIMITTTR
ncbi:hypothetical protein LPJ66_002078 [Kickxella alabastrina]|uniref:Uncharacterized protein n=1 Tax=Kickxella alabastrina TaxID=61397 RepID=A0ACC1IRI5_9FUNG|nr:hypothetical protein LPJ66_002078 [Kickxella alabastrina]